MIYSLAENIEKTFKNKKEANQLKTKCYTN